MPKSPAPIKHERHMTEADWIELREIEATVKDAKSRRARLMNRLRQRAHKEARMI